MKPVLIILFIFFAVRYLRKYLSAKPVSGSEAQRSSTVGASSAARPTTARSGEDMVLDPVCNSYIPVSSALSSDGEHFCGEECRDKFRASRG